MSLELRPMDLTPAKRYVAEHHRHNLPPVGWKFGVAAYVGDELVGVGMAGRPIGRGLEDGYTLEIIRTCTDGYPNACSMLYGALARAGKALGYRRCYTYTLASESGASLRAAGFERDAELPARSGWDCDSRPRYEEDLFGNKRTPSAEAKVRWIRRLAA